MLRRIYLFIGFFTRVSAINCTFFSSKVSLGCRGSEGSAYRSTTSSRWVVLFRSCSAQNEPHKNHDDLIRDRLALARQHSLDTTPKLCNRTLAPPTRSPACVLGLRRTASYNFPYGPGCQVITTRPLGARLPPTGSSVTCTASGGTASSGPSAIRCALPLTSGWTIPREVHLPS